MTIRPFIDPHLLGQFYILEIPKILGTHKIDQNDQKGHYIILYLHMLIVASVIEKLIKKFGLYNSLKILADTLTQAERGL